MKKNWKALLAGGIIAVILAAGLYYRYVDMETPALPPVLEVDAGTAETDVVYIRSPQFHEHRKALLRGDAPVSEAYLMEHVHAEWAKQAVTLFDGVYNQCGVESVSTSTWPDDNTVVVHLGKDGHDPYRVRFSKVHYDPELTTFTYGKTQISQQIPTELNGHAYLFDLTQDEAGGTFEQTDTVTLEQHRETTVTKSVEMNYTLSSETTIGGQYAGVSLEEKLTATFGKAFKDEESQAEGESKSVTEEHKFDVDLEPLKATLVILESVEVHSSTPFTIDGVADWQMDIWVPYACVDAEIVGHDKHSNLVYTPGFLRWYGAGAWYFTDSDNLDWCWRHPTGTQYDPPGSPFHTPCHLTFGRDGNTIEELTQLFRGTHPRWPGMAKHGMTDGWIEHQGHRHDVWNAWHAMQNPDLRHIELTGVQHRVYENTIKETISDVTGQDLDEVARQHSAERPNYNPKGG